MSFDLATDISRDLLVGLQSITSTESNGSTNLLLPSARFTFIDSTVPEIYLPLEACQLFERVFGLVWNATYGMYLVDDALHDILVTRSPSFTFKLGNSKTDGPTVEITLPYDSFDLSFRPEIDSAPVRYFPIQRAANDSQLTLGRTFLQEAYLTTDYERGNFSVSQCKFEESMEQEIVPILSDKFTLPTDTVPGSSAAPRVAHLERQKTIGISVGAVFGFLLLLTLCSWPYIIRYRRKRRVFPNTRAVISCPKAIQHAFQVDYKPSQSSSKRSTPSLQSLLGFYATSHGLIAELGTNSWNLLREAPDNGKVELPENPGRCELSQEDRSATLEDHVSRRRALQTPLNSSRRQGLVVSSSGHLFTLGGLRASRTETAASEEKSASARSIQSSLSKSLPATPVSDSPQESAFPTWARIARHQHEEPELRPPPLRFPERSFQHRRGFF